MNKKILLVSSIVLLAAACQTVKHATYPPDNSSQTNNTATPVVISYKGEQGKTALQILQANYPGGVVTKQTSGAGGYVESINGIKPDDQHFWAFYVNGKISTTDPASYNTKDTDTIEWKIDTINK